MAKNILELPAEYLVLYFYDPDCGHCKKKTPILKAAYQELLNMGVEVVAANIASEEAKWKSYIIENELNWVNVADMDFQSNFRMDYNIKTTPTIYILNNERKIIAKGLDAEQVVEFIESFAL